jgi:hypothetical protein
MEEERKMIKPGCRLVMGMLLCIALTGAWWNSSPSLETTLHFIVDQIQAQGGFN